MDEKKRTSNQSTLGEVIDKLIEGWKTWDMYALTILLNQPHINLHYDASKRLTPTASRFATA